MLSHTTEAGNLVVVQCMSAAEDVGIPRELLLPSPPWEPENTGPRIHKGICSSGNGTKHLRSEREGQRSNGE